jgi:hypothetical protein
VLLEGPPEEGDRKSHPQIGRGEYYGMSLMNVDLLNVSVQPSAVSIQVQPGNFTAEAQRARRG